MKYAEIHELQDLGIIQEANRLLFHPLGLAMEVREDCVVFQDWRADPAGVIFGDAVADPAKHAAFCKFKHEREAPRVEELGYCVQEPEGVHR